ncbi:MAG: MotA/TolQ/ExbB proton channel family protein [Lentimicrobium sp.]|jgi:biopolymer transport protein ExbB|nr:MotA/TolQ/ExbB proton channel family protein [Lentimicrobium sp.]
MKKLIALLTVAGMLTFSVTSIVVAQDQTTPQTEQVATDTATQTTAAPEVAPDETLVAEEDAPQSFHQVLKLKFIEGSPGWMFPVLLVLILGLGLSIERIIYLNLSTTNTQKLLNKVETALEMEGIGAAKEICKNTRGPVASIFYQGLDRYDEGLEMVEKSIVSYGGVLMGRLENNLSWIGLFISLAPMLGFLGTVVGMVAAFDAIEAAGDISPTVVAGGMKIALLTTVFGLIVAIILQIFYNYLISKIDGIVNSMEDATISFMDILVKNKTIKK